MTQDDTKPPDPSAENDATPSTVWCKRCAAQVVPERKGQCPTCHSFLQQNFVARRHPINISARKKHHQRLVADYQPQSAMLVATAEHLAGILERLDAIKPGSPDHQRLILLSQQLFSTLETSRPRPVEASPLEGLSIDELIDRSLALCERALALRDAPAKSVDAPESSPIVVIPDSAPLNQHLEDPTPEC